MFPKKLAYECFLANLCFPSKANAISNNLILSKNIYDFNTGTLSAAKEDMSPGELLKIVMIKECHATC